MPEPRSPFFDSQMAESFIFLGKIHGNPKFTGVIMQFQRIPISVNAGVLSAIAFNEHNETRYGGS